MIWFSPRRQASTQTGAARREVVRGDAIGGANVISERIIHLASNLVLTPGGFRHPSLVHRVEAGHAIDFSEGKTRLKYLATGAMIDVPEY
ncbi:MAG: hypothetical protein WAM39_21450 [Bryobacteraceae bacterium]